MKQRLGTLFLISAILFSITLPIQASEQSGAAPFWSTALRPIRLNLEAEQEFAERTMQIDPEHYLTVTLKEERYRDEMRSTIRRKLTSEYVVKNVTGHVMGSLTVKGTFDTNGSTSIPYSVYGYGSVVGYDVQNTDNTMGSPGSSFWVSSTLVCVPQGYLADFARTCTITCDANGNYSASWN